MTNILLTSQDIKDSAKEQEKYVLQYPHNTIHVNLIRGKNGCKRRRSTRNNL